jgi:hypothetical protein
MFQHPAQTMDTYHIPGVARLTPTTVNLIAIFANPAAKNSTTIPDASSNESVVSVNQAAEPDSENKNDGDAYTSGDDSDAGDDDNNIGYNKL